MKNFKNNISKNKGLKDPRKSSSKNFEQSNFYNGSKNNRKSKNDYKSQLIEEKSNNNQSKYKSQRNFPSSQSVSFKNRKNNYLEKNNKNFDDWIWGKHAVLSCLSSDRPINRIWCTSEIYSSEKFYLLLKDLKSHGILIEEVSWSRLTQITCGGVHQGIALQLASSNTVSLNELINTSQSKSSKPILIALDGITDPHNLGSIIRSAEAFDCNGIILPQRRSVGLTGTVAKVAAGALEHIPVSRVVNLNRAIQELKKNGFIVIGMSGVGQLSISKFKEKSPLVVIIGAENKGISLLTQKHCDHLLKIPLKGKTSSLNASVAAAISLYELSNL